MLAFTRKPPDEDAPAPVELLLDDADDDLTPLTPPPAVERDTPAPAGDVRAMRLVAAPRWDEHGRAAHASLARLAASREPMFGWRRVLFVVSGLCVAPSRAERVLREQIAVLVRSVDPLVLDDDKEAAS